jgi:hypothetical protein
MIRRPFANCRLAEAFALTVAHTITNDSPDGRQWPPPDRDVLWVVVRRADGRTLWRSMQVRSAAADFLQIPRGSNRNARGGL